MPALTWWHSEGANLLGGQEGEDPAETQGHRGAGPGEAPGPRKHVGGEGSERVAGLGSRRAARTFFRSLTWPVMTATTYILMTSSVLQSRKAGSTWPLTVAGTGAAGISIAGALGVKGGRVAEPAAGSGARGGGESSGAAGLRSAPPTPAAELTPGAGTAGSWGCPQATPPWQILTRFLICFLLQNEIQPSKCEDLIGPWPVVQWFEH